MRLIDADALYEELRYMPYDNILEGTIGHDRPLRAIVNAPTVEMPGWISVKDRLPEKDGVYLAFYDGYTVSSVWYERGREHSEWTDDYEEYCDLDVTHWMPLPEPPKKVI